MVSAFDGRIEFNERLLFEELYEPLRRFAAVVMPPGLDPDDLVQEALVRVLRKHRLNDLEHPAAFLRRTILNLVWNERRRRRIRRRAEAEWAASASRPVAPTFPSDLTDLMRLSPQARAVLYLVEVEGFRFDEVAEMLGCSSAAARKRASRARKHLQAALAAETL
jgi:RNA polymerase sigma-70 factor (ECF subfamily)